MNNVIECILFNLDTFLVNTSVFLFGYKVFLSNVKTIENDIEHENDGKLSFFTDFHFEGDSPFEQITSIRETIDNPNRKIMMDDKEVTFREFADIFLKEREDVYGNKHKKSKERFKERKYYFVAGLLVIVATFISLIKSNEFAKIVEIITFLLYLLAGYIFFQVMNKID